IRGDAFDRQAFGNAARDTFSAGGGIKDHINRGLADRVHRQETRRMDEESKNKRSGNPLYLIGTILGIVAAVIAILQFAGIAKFQDLFHVARIADPTSTTSNPYGIAGANLILDDPMTDNSKGAGWDQITVSNSFMCKLDSTGYIDDVKAGWSAACDAKAPS